MKKGCLIITVITLVAFAIGIVLVYRVFFIPSGIEIDKTKYPITGIDISKHTGKIDFKKVKSQSFDFVFLKATEGENYIDEKFENNYLEAKLNAIPLGAYHFFRFNKSGKVQADHFLSSVRGKSFDLPYVLDIEKWGNLGQTEKVVVIKEISIFIKELEQNTSKSVMIYTNESGFKEYISGYFDDKKIWICSFNDPPNIRINWTFWQHSHKGRIEGAEGYVDINTFNGDKNEWEKFLKK